MAVEPEVGVVVVEFPCGWVVRCVPPTAVTHGHDDGKLGLNFPVVALFAPVSSSIQKSGSIPLAVPQSDVLTTTVTPRSPSFMNSRHCRNRYWGGKSASL